MEISKRVEKFIQDCTRNCSNELIAICVVVIACLFARLVLNKQ
jgi:hypothetical protein